MDSAYARGFDVFRDGLNTPAFFSTLPELRGSKGIDIGCGEGHNTRLLAEKGAQLQAIDISEVFIRSCKSVGTCEAAGNTVPGGKRHFIALLG